MEQAIYCRLVGPVDSRRVCMNAKILVVIKANYSQVSRNCPIYHRLTDQANFNWMTFLTHLKMNNRTTNSIRYRSNDFEI